MVNKNNSQIEIKIGDYGEIMSNRDKFNRTIYTPLSEALKILEERQKDKVLILKINKLLNNNIPDVCLKNKCAIMARQIATPNYENRMFLSIAKENDLHPVFLEYFEDKFTSNNKFKNSLGQLLIQKDFDCNGDDCVEKISIVNFNKFDGKKLKDVKTVWGESLVDFHKSLFDLYKINNFSFLNELEWYKKPEGEKPFDFYVNFFLLMTCYGILFENFLLFKDEKNTEGDFTKKVILPAFEKVINMTGVKPIIVPIDSLDLETDNFWFYHLPLIKTLVKNKIF